MNMRNLHVYLEVNVDMISRAYFQVNKHRNEALLQPFSCLLDSKPY